MPGILLAVHTKRTQPVDLVEPLGFYIAGTYGEQAAADAEDDLAAVQRLREEATDGAKPPAALAEALARYHRALAAMEPRFPVGPGPGEVGLAFSWADAFRPKTTAAPSLPLERAAVVFNLGAALSKAALDCDRRAETGLKASARLFAEAAGAFAHLREAAAPRLDAPPPDLSPECAGMLERLMLAQAQECVLEKAAADGKSPAARARLARQVADWYADCRTALAGRPLADHLDRSWAAHASVKAALYAAEAWTQHGAALAAGDDDAGCAREVAALRAAKAALAGARRDARAASKELQENVAAAEERVAARLARAERENSTVYLQRVPDADDLPPVAPAALVRAAPPEGLRPDAAAAALFRGVVPEASARAVSKYSQMVDDVTRRAADELAAASDEARLRLRQLEQPESLAALGGGAAAGLPDAVRADLDAVAAAGGLPHLRELAAQLADLRRVAGEELAAAEAELDAEAADDDGLRAHYGPRWRRQPSSAAAAPMRARLAGYRGNLAAAAASDAKLEARLAAEAPAWAALDVDAVAASMPRLREPMLAVEADDGMAPAAAVRTLRTSLDALGALAAQRAALEEALRDLKARDNVLPALVAAAGEGDAAVDALFARELRKYDDLVGQVRANAERQAGLLDAVAAADATFKAAYGFDEWRRACAGAARGARAAAASFREAAAQAAEGVGFYSNLHDALRALRVQVGDYCAARRVQREDEVEALRREAAAEEVRAQQALAALSVQQHAPPPPPQAGGYGYGGGAPQQQYGGYGSGPPPPPPPPLQQGWGPPPPPPPPYYGGPLPAYGQQQQAGYGQPPPAYGQQQQQQSGYAPQGGPPPAPPPSQHHNPLNHWLGK